MWELSQDAENHPEWQAEKPVLEWQVTEARPPSLADGLGEGPGWWASPFIDGDAAERALGKSR